MCGLGGFGVSVGEMTEEMITKYIGEQGKNENF